MINKPIYEVVNGQFKINPKQNDEINFTGLTWCDSKWMILEKVLNPYKKLITDSDLLAHDDYIELLLSNNIKKIFFTITPTSVSQKRRARAVKKIRAHGIKVSYVK